jgi:pimeloyl-ACP methyl ester carboxylesterase
VKKAALNGAVLAWEESGAGPPVLLVHGLSETHASWRYQREVLAQRFRVIACDVRGFGESETGDAASRPDQYADDLHALLVHLGIARAAIVGFSMGGVIGQSFAIRHPGLTSALVIAASSSVVNRQAAEYFLERARLAETLGLEAVRATTVSDAAACFATSSPEVVEAYRQLRRGAIRDARGYRNACRAMASLREQPLTEGLANIRCPSLVITGERDSLCPPKASEIIRAKIPDSRLSIAAGVGHCLHWEDPSGFNEIVVDFLSSGLRETGISTEQQS